jgi:hypothetical protein
MISAEITSRWPQRHGQATKTGDMPPGLGQNKVGQFPPLTNRGQDFDRLAITGLDHFGKAAVTLESRAFPGKSGSWFRLPPHTRSVRTKRS